MASNFQEICREHSKEKEQTIIFCEQCSTKLCRLCVIDNFHDGHKKVKIEDCPKVLLSKVKGVKQSSESRMSFIEERLRRVNENEANSSNALEKAIKNISALTNSAVDKVKELERTIQLFQTTAVSKTIRAGVIDLPIRSDIEKLEEFKRKEEVLQKTCDKLSRMSDETLFKDEKLVAELIKLNATQFSLFDNQPNPEGNLESFFAEKFKPIEENIKSVIVGINKEISKQLTSLQTSVHSATDVHFQWHFCS